MKKAKIQSVPMNIRVDLKTDAQLEALAAAQNTTKSAIVRTMIDKQLTVEGYRKDEEQLYVMIRDAVKEVTKPQTDRLATISAKASQIAGAAFFLLVYIGRMLLPNADGQLMDEVAARSRKLGIEYLKTRDEDIDHFIEKGIKRVKDE